MSNVKKSGKKKKQFALVIPEKPVATSATPPTQPEAPAEATQPAKSTYHAELAARIADELGEKQRFPRSQIKHIIWALGHQQTLDLVKQAKEIYNGEGLMIPSGTRKRTLGGIFFYLAYSEGKPKEGRRLTRPTWKPPKPAETVKEAHDEH